MNRCHHTKGIWRATGFQGGKSSLVRGHKIQAELPCINGLSAWFDLAYVYERDREEELMTDGALADAGADARLMAASQRMKAAIEGLLDAFGGYVCPEVDAGIAVMQEIGVDRWSMQARLEATAEKAAEPANG